MGKIQVRINGRGNAWPVILGKDHPFYDRTNYEDMANASCSIIKSSAENPKATDIEWELMIDAGHGAVQYLLKYCNRIPDVLFITHPHIDHTLGIDWIVQSYCKLNKKPYPVYATRLCWEKTRQAFPHLETMVNFKELIPGQEIDVDEIDGVRVQSFPVYHGKSADGSAMLLFTEKSNSNVKRILVTGDLLCPLLKEEDYNFIQDIDLLIADANNRYPYPKSNHWSVTDGVDNNLSDFLLDFLKGNTIETLLYAHLKDQQIEYNKQYFDYFIENGVQLSDFHFTIASFVNRIKPKLTALVHYSGGEDEKYYGQKQLNMKELDQWLGSISTNLELPTRFLVPYVSQHIKI